jgi:hypothetical protein
MAPLPGDLRYTVDRIGSHRYAMLTDRGWVDAHGRPVDVVHVLRELTGEEMSDFHEAMLEGPRRPDWLSAGPGRTLAAQADRFRCTVTLREHGRIVGIGGATTIALALDAAERDAAERDAEERERADLESASSVECAATSHERDTRVA